MKQPHPSRRTRFALAVLLAGALGGPATASTAAQWPTVNLPGLSTFPIAEQLAINGVAMRLHGVVAPEPPDRLAASVARALGPGVRHSALGSRRILGMPHGAHYITVHLDPAGTGSRGVLAITRVASRESPHGATAQLVDAAVRALGPDTRVLSRTEMRDGERAGAHVVAANGAAVPDNAARLTGALGRAGWRLERDSGERGGRALAFATRTHDLLAVIRPHPGGGSSLVLNSVGRGGPTP